MQLYRLPDFTLGRSILPNGLERQVEKYLAACAPVPEEHRFCGVRVETYATPYANLQERAGMVSHIPFVATHTSWTALERATALLAERAVHHGWHFHMPMSGPMQKHFTYLRTPADSEIAEAYDAINKMSENDEPQGWHDHLHDIGAKGRRQVYLRQAEKPIGFALGIRLRSKQVEQADTASAA